MARALRVPVALWLLGLCWSLAKAHPLVRAPELGHGVEGGNVAKPDPDVTERCSDGWGFDATTLDEHGNMLFLKGEFVWKGHAWARQLISERWKDAPSPVDAAFRYDRNSVLLIKGDKFWVYPPEKGEEYPKLLQEKFPGIPFPLDAAVECHHGECSHEGVFFFQGHAHRNATQHMDKRCSPHLVLSALLSDNHGATYAFSENHYWRLDSSRDGWHSWLIEHLWPQGPSTVDAAFLWDKKLYLIQGTQVYIFLTRAGYTLVKDYPKQLEKEFGSPDGVCLHSVDAAFTCPGSSQLYIMAGQKLWRLDLNLGAQATWTELPWLHTKVDGALCTEKSLGPHSCSANGLGLYLVQGPNLYCYKDVEELSKTKDLPQAQRMNSLLGCAPHQHS
ncbi:hemopexin isoform X2 [Bos indicus]|uniref:Hemopexin isoform X2 n=1 Tax=Bos indicus TaxID=9915 RepID=A0A6P5D126_BOSIN